MADGAVQDKPFAHGRKAGLDIQAAVVVARKLHYLDT
jgi:hypothetical protein